MSKRRSQTVFEPALEDPLAEVSKEDADLKYFPGEQGKPTGSKPEAKKKIRKKPTDEQRKRWVEMGRLSSKKKFDSLTPDEKQAFIAKRKERTKRSRQRRTAEQREIRNAKARLLNLKKKAKKLNLEVEDENNPITVTRSGIGGSSKTLKINLRNYCVFCLRKTTNHREALSVADNPHLTELLQTVPKAEFSSSKPNLQFLFNQIWPYLQQKEQTVNGETQQLFAFLQSLTTLGTTFSDIPIMCQFCADKLEHVDKLLREAMETVHRLRKTINESRFGGKFAWRAVDFERALKSFTSRFEGNSARDTVEFLYNVGSNSSGVNVSGTSTFLQPSQLAPTFLIVNPSALPGGPVSFAGTLTNITSTPHVLPVPIIPKPQPNLLFPTTVPATIQVDGKVEGMDFQEEGDAEDEFNSNDPDYIKTEPEPEDDSTSNSEDDDYQKEGTSTGDNSTCSLPTTSASGTRSNGYIISASNIPSETFVGTAVRGNVGKIMDPNENVTFVTSVDPVTGRDTYTCLIDGCGVTFDKRGRGLMVHQRLRHKDKLEDPTKVCSICRKVFSDSAALKTHKETVHPNVDNEIKAFPAKCDLCKLEVMSTDMLNHSKTHLGPLGEEYLLKCPNPQCPLVFFKAFSVTNHCKSLACRPFSNDADKTTKITRVCELCGITENTALKLRAHINTAHETATKNYSCPIDGCEQKFTHKQSIILHLPQHEFRQEFEKQKCNLCKTQTELEKMEEHLRDVHQAQEIFKCNQCPFLFSTRESQLDHLFVHRYSGLFCDICNDNVKYPRHTQLLEHYFQAHKIGSKVLCDKCDKVFWSKTNLLDHFKRVHQSDGPLKIDSFACDECDVVFKTKMSVTDHKMKVHGAKPHCCPFCSETFTSSSVFNKHKKEHQGVNIKQEFRCEVEGCGKVFVNKAGLKYHHSSVHLGEKANHVCELCGKSYSTGSGLQKHIDQVHLERVPRSHVCDVCGAGFTAGNILKRHKLIHTGERPFACEICDQRFRHKEVLKRHVESHERKGADFKPNGPMKQIRKRVEKK